MRGSSQAPHTTCPTPCRPAAMRSQPGNSGGAGRESPGSCGQPDLCCHGYADQLVLGGKGVQKSLGCTNHLCAPLPQWARICPGSLAQSKLWEWSLAPLDVGPEPGLEAGTLSGQPQCGKSLDGALQKFGGGNAGTGGRRQGHGLWLQGQLSGWGMGKGSTLCFSQCSPPTARAGTG